MLLMCFHPSPILDVNYAFLAEGELTITYALDVVYGCLSIILEYMFHFINVRSYTLPLLRVLSTH